VTDAERLRGYVDVWWQAVGDFTAFLDRVPTEEWSTPTDLAGWDVHACAAHTAHIEAVLAGETVETGLFDAGSHVANLTQAYTKQGVLARRGSTPQELIDGIRTSAALRHELLLADPPQDAGEMPPVTPGGIDWNWETLLRNRPLDVWMHEQDVRRAVGRPGDMETPAAQHTADYLLEGMPMVLAKRAGAPPGTTLVVAVEGSRRTSYGVADSGRAGVLPEIPADPTVSLSMSRESFIVLAGGRRTPGDVTVTVEGDTELGARILAGMALTP
jgi:uncharacterized protein (TIGR03083 family)